MTIRQLTAQERTVVQSNPGMSSYLTNLERGRPMTPRSWLYEDQPEQAVLTQWLEVLRTLQDSETGRIVYQFDTRQLEKFGPQGGIPPISEALVTMEPSYAPYSPELPEISESQSKEIAQALFNTTRLGTQRPRSYERVVDDMATRDTLSTNSGWPDFGRRKRDEILHRAIQDARSGVAYEYPAIILFRYYNKKLRPVWMYPMAMNLIEGSFTQVIQLAIRGDATTPPDEKVYSEKPKSGLAYTAPWSGFEEVKKQVTIQWRDAKLAVGGDTTQMDAHFRSEHMQLVFKVVRWLFQRSYWDALWVCMRHVNDIQIVVGPNSKLVGQHGVASGSGWTQLCETVYQFIMFYLSKRVVAGSGIGDDLAWFSRDTKITLSGVAKYLQQWGLPANAAKQSVSQGSLTYLQRLFLEGYPSRGDKRVLGGIYPTIRALNSSLNPERFHNPKTWNSDMFCIRQYMILENVVDHPLFEEFAQFVARGQKDLVPFAKRVVADHAWAAELQTASRELPGLNPTYNQEKRFKPLYEFEGIKYVAQLE